MDAVSPHIHGQIKMADRSVDVLIVGAGPTGLTMALELALHDISFRIIDKLITPSDKSRALVIHPRSLELLRRHGIAEEIVERSTVGTGARVYVNKKKAVEFNIDDLGFESTAFPAPIWISQADTESILASHLESTYDVEIERGALASEMTQDGSGVNVTITRDDETEHLRCSYVVGCDGAHSEVRHAAGLSFEGAPYPQDFILCDAHMKWDLADEEAKPLTAFFGPTGILVMFPMQDGVVRLVASRPPDFLKDSDLDSDPTLDNFRTLIGKMIPGEVEMYDPIWLARFRLHHRAVSSFRKNRLLLAGDAAHIHSPAGGQGMNTGIQDAINLAWKLGHVVAKERRGQKASEEWLDSYHEERHRVGMHLLRETDRLFEYASSTNYFWLIFRNFAASWILPWMVSSRERRARLFRFISQLGIRYRFSSVVRASKGTSTVKGGDRAPDGRARTPDGEKWLLEMFRGDRHHLILFSGTGTQRATPEDMESVHKRFAEVFTTEGFEETDIHSLYTTDAEAGPRLTDVENNLHKTYGFEKPGYVLVRPDGYVACIDSAPRLEEMLDWVKAYCEK